MGTHPYIQDIRPDMAQLPELKDQDEIDREARGNFPAGIVILVTLVLWAGVVLYLIGKLLQAVM